MEAIVLCEVCDEPIVRARLEDLQRPLIGRMFLPLGKAYSLPFQDDASWEWFRCPYCNCRPMICTEEQIEAFVIGTWAGPERVMTTDGFFVIGSDDFPAIPALLKIKREERSNEELAEEWAQRQGELKAELEEECAKRQSQPSPPRADPPKEALTPAEILRRHAKRITRNARLD
jgi:hypothetical protein